MSSSNSPCAACKFLRRKCTQECVFAPYFPPDHPQKFQDVHRVFGASNVTKLLNEIPTNQREDAVNSLAFEARARLQDPIYGCVGFIHGLRQRAEQLQYDLLAAKKELANYIGPTAMLPILPTQGYLPIQHQGNTPSMIAYNMPMMGVPAHGQLVIREPQQQQQYLHQQQQMYEAQQLAAAVAVREQQDIKWAYDQQQPHEQTQQHEQQQQELMSFNSGYDGSSGNVTATGYNQSQLAEMTASGSTVSPSLALGGSFDNLTIQSPPLEHAHPHNQLQGQILLQPQLPQQEHHQLQQQQQQQQRSDSEEGGNVGPSC